MPIVNNKVGDERTVSTDKAAVDGKALVDSLIKVVACYRHLASCVGGCTDSLQLRDELRQTREKAHKLSVSIRQHLTQHLRDKSLPKEQRADMELLWVSFSSSLELLHLDMCKVFHMGGLFSLANTNELVHNGLQGGGSEVAARALSLPDLNQAPNPALHEGLEVQEHSATEREVCRLDHMIEDMELKVNVLRWMVEPRVSQYVEPLSETSSLGVMSVEEEHAGPRPLWQKSQMLVLLLLIAVVIVAVTLAVCIVFFS